MDNTRLKEIIWSQFGGAIDALDAVLEACPETVWSNPKLDPPFWAMAFHALFWLDHYLEGVNDGFHPPAPFGLEEMDPAGVLPPRVYTKEELRTYLSYCREKLRTLLGELTEEKATRPYRFRSWEATWLELSLYNMRHVQHHTGQLNLIMRREADTAARWVGRAKTPLTGAP